MINASEIARREHARKNLRKEAYRNILEQFSKKIKTASDRSERAAHLKVPPLVIGFPLYPFDEACEYMARQLVLSGYTVRKGLEQGEFMVTWEKAKPARGVPNPIETQVQAQADDLFSSLANLQKTASRLRGSGPS